MCISSRMYWTVLIKSTINSLWFRTWHRSCFVFSMVYKKSRITCELTINKRLNSLYELVLIIDNHCSIWFANLAEYKTIIGHLREIVVLQHSFFVSFFPLSFINIYVFLCVMWGHVSNSIWWRKRKIDRHWERERETEQKKALRVLFNVWFC